MTHTAASGTLQPLAHCSLWHTAASGTLCTCTDSLHSAEAGQDVCEEGDVSCAGREAGSEGIGRCLQALVLSPQFADGSQQLQEITDVKSIWFKTVSQSDISVSEFTV